MAVTIGFEIGPPCLGGGHFAVSASLTVGAQVRRFALHGDRRAFRQAPDPGELENCLLQLFRLLAGQLLLDSAANIKSAIESKVLDLTVVG